MSLERFFLLHRCPHPTASENGMPSWKLEGVHLVAGPTPEAFDSRHVVELTATILDPAVPIAAKSAAEALAAAVARSVESKVSATPEAEVLRKAAGELANAKAEMTKCEAARDAAKEAYDSAVANGRDPRPYRPALDAAAKELADVSAWFDSLTRAYRAANAAAVAVRDNLSRVAAAGVCHDMAKRREKLEKRCESIARELCSELLEIAEVEQAFRAK